MLLADKVRADDPDERRNLKTAAGGVGRANVDNDLLAKDIAYNGPNENSANQVRSGQSMPRATADPSNLRGSLVINGGVLHNRDGSSISLDRHN